MSTPLRHNRIRGLAPFSFGHPRPRGLVGGESVNRDRPPPVGASRKADIVSGRRLLGRRILGESLSLSSAGQGQEHPLKLAKRGAV